MLLMELISCRRCGSNELIEIADQMECVYCQSRYAMDPKVNSPVDTVIEVDRDVERLLALCRKDAKNRRRYAALALDIDPFNQEAMRYLT